jgi:hypothetical protein
LYRIFEYCYEYRGLEYEYEYRRLEYEYEYRRLEYEYLKNVLELYSSTSTEYYISVLWLDQLNVFPVHYERMRGLGDGVRLNAIAEATHAVAA